MAALHEPHPPPISDMLTGASAILKIQNFVETKDLREVKNMRLKPFMGRNQKAKIRSTGSFGKEAR